MLLRLALFLGLFLAPALPTQAAQLVPPGNRNVEQPPVPGASARRTAAGKSSYEAKYRKVYQLLRNDPALIRKIRSISARYGIEPIHMVGAIVGEHTYNVDAYDRLQTYYVKAVAYLKNSFAFSHQGETIGDFIQRAQFKECLVHKDSYDLWSCREQVWDEHFRGKRVDGKKFPNDRFSAVFFQPLYAGQTFGLGQLNPLTALQMTDLVHRVSGYPKLDFNDPQEVYRTIMDPDVTLAYVAAVLKKSMDAYRTIAGFDISRNPGITATLYNLGNPEARAAALAAENRIRRNQGKEARLPQENYYGWLVNDKLDELMALFQDS
ncbi:uncharacterized protein DUF1402 [Mesorhizobium sp. J18]|uniref:DUF1402 family protein n=1 Tax=Mesorhizobium sp. J18 TaxID=935263 RepID=UPI0011990DD2|nr:DUF1402 family protein [Mesorhizobium sp. J18]TWG88975.1 uncharacterized protein DUF1402 [Mesorhizobium sp. J18]